MKIQGMQGFNLRFHSSPQALLDTSHPLVMESGLRTFFVVSPSNIDGLYKYLVLSKPHGQVTRL